ncbi:hypothetical protein WJX72_012476 [[Myrmecia] bisecta]|uniref:Plasma membrane fusion protein PRM1 n=1 Tax=[Myrmecia] bisecta TaxID=41462 RepID=A0AAW1Q5S2_9CHLO
MPVAVTTMARSTWLVVVVMVALAAMPVTPAAADTAFDNSKNDVCPKAEWRSTSSFSAATPNSGFNPREVDYYKNTVRAKLYGPIIILVVTIALFFYFIIWRVMKFCCQCCCGCCCWNCCAPDSRPGRLLKGRGMLIMRILVFAMSIGILIVAAYGMTKVAPDFVPKAFSLVDAIRAFLVAIFKAGDAIVADVNAVRPILDTVQSILTTDVNPAGINASIACLSPWLVGLVDPATIQTELQSIDTTILGTLTPTITSLSSNIPALVGTVIVALQPAAVNLDGAIFTNYKADAQTFIDAVNAANGYPAPATKQPTSGPVNSALQQLQTAAYTTKIQNFQAAARVFYTYQSDPTIPNTIANLQTLQSTSASLGTILPALSAQLQSIVSGYQTARPCMVSLIDQIQHINATVIALPASMQTSVDQLDSTMASLDTFLLGGTFDPLALASEIDLVTSSLVLPPSVSTTLSNLTAFQQKLSNLPNMNNFADSLDSIKNASTSAYTALDAFVASRTDYQNGGTQLQYDDMSQKARDARDALIPITLPTAEDSNINAASSAASSINTGLTGLPSQADLLSQMGTIQGSIATLPVLATYVTGLNGPTSAYAALPSPKDGVLSSASQTIMDLNNNVGNAISTTRQTVQDNVQKVQDKLWSTSNSTVGKIDTNEAKYKPKVESYDKKRQAGEYAYFAVVIFVVLVLCVTVLVHCQWLATSFTFLLLLLMLIYTLIGLVFCAIAVVGHDGCVNLEAQVIVQLQDQFKDDPSKLAKALPLAQYYLYGTGGNFTSVAKQALNVDFDNMLAKVNSTRDDAISKITGSYNVRPKLQAVIDSLIMLSVTVQGHIGNVMTLVSYDSIHPIYIQAKTLVCCDAIDMLGNLWMCMFATAVLATILILTMFTYIRTLDRLPDKACCGCTTRSYKEWEKPLTRREKRELDEAAAKGKGRGANGKGAMDFTMAAPDTPTAMHLLSPFEDSGGSGYIHTEMVPQGFSTDVIPMDASQRMDSVGGVKPSEGSSGSLLSPGLFKKGGGKKKAPKTEADAKKNYMQHVMRMT